MILGRSFYEIGVKCLDLKHLRNRYDKEYYTVPCRKCAACLESRRRSIISRLETLRSNSVDCFFVTLTYDDYYLPLAHFSNDAQSCDYVSYNLLHRRKETYHLDISSHCEVIDKFLLRRGGFSTTGVSYGPYNFGILIKSDLQKFFKRFRKKFHAVFPQDFRFRYFAIGEYGVESFRPHFHVMFYFNRSHSCARLLELVRYSWKFGRVDVQRTKSSSASYCASYLNTSTRIPAFLRDRRIRPFQVCSNGTFFEMWPEQVKEFVKTELYKVPLFRSVPTESGFTLRPLSRSTRLQFFPVMPGFHQLSIESLRWRYARFKEAAESQSTLDPVFHLSYKFGDYILDDDIPFSMLYSFSIPIDSNNKKTFEYITHREFMELYISRRVYLFAKEHNLDFDRYVDAIIYYYKGRSIDDIDEYCYSIRHYSNAPTQELPSSSHALSMLRSQYSIMEFNVSCFDDLRLYYDQYNNRSNTELYKYGDKYFSIVTDDDSFCFHDLLKVDNSDSFDFIKSLACLKSDLVVKHKERNTYWALENHKCFI